MKQLLAVAGAIGTLECSALAAFAVFGALSGVAGMLTPWGESVTGDNAWRDYPRPQMVRGNWTCLNGFWDYAITSNVNHMAVEVAKGKILVPFAFEAPLSGVGRLVEPHEKMVYTRQIEVHPKKGLRTLLNFEAVDWRASVFVNGVEAMDAPHEGGNLPFSVDITPFVRDGMNDLKVVVWDPTHTFINAGGKQNDKTAGCFYTRVSGIWQTVWMEEVPEKYIRGYKVVTDIDNSTARFEFDIAGGGDVTVKVEGLSSEQPTVRTADHVAEVKIPNAELWSPENPKLYEFTAKCGRDEIRGYFAMRKIDRAKDSKGHWRFRLNNKFMFPIGTLDQGWWPDGLLTPPSLAACEHDIRTLKDCGYNMMRKHIKVEPRLYYHLCDKLGLMVFQDAPSPAGSCNIFNDEKSLQRYGMFRREWKEEVDHLFSVPSIVMWIPYNEAWGQPDAEYTENTLRWTRRYDPTRLVGGPSGWNDFEGGEWVENPGHKIIRDPGVAEASDPSCDTVDQHNYPGPGQCARHGNRISLLGEFGGLGLRIPGHLWDAKKSWGYAGTGKVANREENQKHYLELMDKLIPLVKDGLAGAVYTQTTDVEIEINGLMTYDRKVQKFDSEVLKSAHEKIISVAADAAKSIEE